VGDVVAVNALLLQLSQPMNFIGYTVAEIRQGLVDLDYVSRVLRDAPQPVGAGDAPPTAPPEIRFDRVSASRDGGRTLSLDGASFTAPAGGVTVLVGASGSGKTTAFRSALESITGKTAGPGYLRTPLSRPNRTRFP